MHRQRPEMPFRRRHRRRLHRPLSAAARSFERRRRTAARGGLPSDFLLCCRTAEDGVVCQRRITLSPPPMPDLTCPAAAAVNAGDDGAEPGVSGSAPGHRDEGGANADAAAAAAALVPLRRDRAVSVGAQAVDEAAEEDLESSLHRCAAADAAVCLEKVVFLQPQVRNLALL